MYQFISSLSILFHWSIPLSLCQNHTVSITVVSQYDLKWGRYEPSNCVLFQDCFGYLGPLKFHKKLKISFSSSAKKVTGILIDIILNMYTVLHSIAILMLSLQIHKHKISFHLFRSSLISFNSVVQLSEYRSFNSCMLLDASMNGTVFLISFLDSIPVVYRNTIVFCVILYLQLF